jgi:alkaline phosphatase D
MKRRDFLFGSIATVFYVACGSVDRGLATRPGDDDPEDESDGGTRRGEAGASADAQKPITKTSTPDESDRVFPQGLASGDPRADRVILWCRVEAAEVGKAETDDVEVVLLVATDEAFTAIVLETKIPARADGDHTVRVVPTGLDAGRTYYYRFESGGVTTRVARTRTAPLPDADVQVKLAFCACQDRIGRYWHAWQALLDENVDFDFILYLGDYIYESVNDARFQTSTPGRDVTLPDGMDTSPEQDGSRIAAATLADYRALYKAYRADPLIKEVHRLYPFILVWDDHEFADDCWQDHSTSFNELDPQTGNFTSEENTPRRLAADRAFSEYQPIELAYDPNATFPGDIKIYRQLNWGRHVDLFLTDQRLYRDDHLIPEGPTDISIGKFSANSMIGSRYFVRKSAFDPREAEATPTLLGLAQKQWLLGAMTSSRATWKVWGNEVQMWQMTLRLGDLPLVPGIVSYTAYVNCDQWDGFRSERNEILSTLAAANVQSLLVLTGDIHAYFASELRADFDAPASPSIGVEYVTAGISSASLKELVDKYVPDGSALRPVADAWASGADAALRTSNAHLRFADSDAYGFATATIDGTEALVTFVQVGTPTSPTTHGVIARTKFRTRVGTNEIEII